MAALLGKMPRLQRAIMTCPTHGLRLQFTTTTPTKLPGTFSILLDLQPIWNVFTTTTTVIGRVFTHRGFTADPVCRCALCTCVWLVWGHTGAALNFSDDTHTLCSWPLTCIPKSLSYIKLNRFVCDDPPRTRLLTDNGLPAAFLVFGALSSGLSPSPALLWQMNTNGFPMCTFPAGNFLHPLTSHPFFQWEASWWPALVHSTPTASPLTPNFRDSLLSPMAYFTASLLPDLTPHGSSAHSLLLFKQQIPSFSRGCLILQCCTLPSESVKAGKFPLTQINMALAFATPGGFW